jgi:hypothetical protein
MEEMEGEVTDLLREAVRLLRIMARPQITELRERFSSSMLASAKRRKMWEHMDGNRSLTDIGNKVGTTAEAVRQFLADVEAKWPDLVEVNKSGAATFPRRLI